MDNIEEKQPVAEQQIDKEPVVEKPIETAKSAKTEAIKKSTPTLAKTLGRVAGAVGSVFDRVINLTDLDLFPNDGPPPLPYMPYKYNPFRYLDKDYCQPNHQQRSPHQKGGERFPIIYDNALKYKPDAKRILSFGCSYGDEIQALARRFPDADMLVGCDIEPACLREARRSNKNNKIFFTDEIEVAGMFDLITALQVFFCLDTKLPKDRWERNLRKIDRHLNPGGVVIVYTSEYPLEEIFSPDKYEPLNVYTREHNKKPGSCYYNGYFRKKA